MILVIMKNKVEDTEEMTFFPIFTMIIFNLTFMIHMETHKEIIMDTMIHLAEETTMILMEILMDTMIPLVEETTMILMEIQ